MMNRFRFPKKYMERVPKKEIFGFLSFLHSSFQTLASQYQAIIIIFNVKINNSVLGFIAHFCSFFIQQHCCTAIEHMQDEQRDKVHVRKKKERKRVYDCKASESSNIPQRYCA